LASEEVRYLYSWKGTPTHACDLCGAKLYSQVELDHHKSLLHYVRLESIIGTPITFRCARCGSAFAYRCNLMDHLSTHQQGIERSKPRSPRPKRRRIPAHDRMHGRP
jgi:uncharacterized C2H2 Zn-finger protein